MLSGVPQGSILGSLLFVLLINDIYTRIDKDTNTALYANDTKMWREINSEHDCTMLQKDIDTLLNWPILNKMLFHLGKCKVAQIHNNEPLCNMHTLAKYYYTLNSDIVEFTDLENDQGVLVNSRFKWDDDQKTVLNKAHQMPGTTKRSCDFITDARKPSSLYISLVRSQFEHCSTTWRPATESVISAFDKLQKKAIKWMRCEPYRQYDNETYLHKCVQMKIIPMMAFFNINDLVFFHKIVYNKVPFSLLNFIQPYTGQERLRNLNLDYLSFINITISGSASFSIISLFYKSFFHTVIHEWNSHPLQIRVTSDTLNFKHQVTNHFWSELHNKSSNPTSPFICIVLTLDIMR